MILDRNGLWSVLGFILFFMLGMYRADAAIGVVDTENRFPYVVRVDLGNGSCSGVVTSDNLVTTAAHCIWDAEEASMRKPSDLKVLYTDIYGVEKRIGVKKTFITNGYEAFAPWKQITWAANFERAQQDVAILIPEELIEIDGYAHWITELIGPPFSNLQEKLCPGSSGKCGKPTEAQSDQLLAIIKNELGPLDGVRTLIVGYGGFACDKYTIDRDGNDDCRHDNQRRYAEAPSLERVTANGSSSGIPHIWCAGANQDGSNPVRRGDSGGPMFVRAKDGRWLFVGYLAIGGPWGCASSILYNIDFWQSVLESDDYKAMPRWRSATWYQRQTKRAVDEMFEAFSSQDDEALAHLRTLYQLHLDDHGQLTGEGGLRDRDDLHKSLYEQKRKLIEQWPVRKFAVEDDTVQTENVIYRAGHDSEGDFYKAQGIAHWELSNPATGESKQGRSKFLFVIATSGIEESEIAGGYVPRVFEESIDGLRITFSTNQPNNDPVFEYLPPDQSLEGGDIWNKKGLSLGQCQNACGNDGRCQSFSYIERLRWCWGKSSVPAAVDKPGISSAVKSAPELHAFEEYSDESLEGSDYANRRHTSLDQCRSICYADKKCQSYSYVERLQWCWLKSGTPDLVYKAGISSGIRQ